MLESAFEAAAEAARFGGAIGFILLFVVSNGNGKRNGRLLCYFCSFLRFVSYRAGREKPKGDPRGGEKEGKRGRKGREEERRRPSFFFFFSSMDSVSTSIFFSPVEWATTSDGTLLAVRSLDLILVEGVACSRPSALRCPFFHSRVLARHRPQVRAPVRFKTLCAPGQRQNSERRKIENSGSHAPRFSSPIDERELASFLSAASPPLSF